ncbi:MAG: AbrB/MazE/SpoVT family DNA-binding domain-containing protein [Chloroflexi bacterium]|nr:AbrB/MazE/SpoVT family DNA-binding domain-containing protein [Chloroflexota bacterium]
MPLAKMKPKGQITIPKPVRDQLGLSAGDLVEIDVEGDRCIIIPQRVVPAVPAPKLSVTEQRALTKATKKIAAIKKDLVTSRGLTQDEAAVAAKAGLIDPGQIWFWLEDWQKGEREAERDIMAGRVQTFKTPEEFRNALKAL